MISRITRIRNREDENPGASSRVVVVERHVSDHFETEDRVELAFYLGQRRSTVRRRFSRGVRAWPRVARVAGNLAMRVVCLAYSLITLLRSSWQTWAKRRPALLSSLLTVLPADLKQMS